jgi:hypothetical protein
MTISIVAIDSVLNSTRESEQPFLASAPTEIRNSPYLSSSWDNTVDMHDGCDVPGAKVKARAPASSRRKGAGKPALISLSMLSTRSSALIATCVQRW